MGVRKRGAQGMAACLLAACLAAAAGAQETRDPQSLGLRGLSSSLVGLDTDIGGGTGDAEQTGAAGYGATEAGPAESWRRRRFGLRGGSASFIWENDIFGGTDANYTNGLQLELNSGPEEQLLFTGLLANVVPNRYQPDNEGKQWRTRISLGHVMFTPRDISLEDPDPLDRPYAGWAYASVALYGITGRTLDMAELTVGLVGDGAGGEWVQRNFHQLIDGEEPRGWSQQLKDEPGIILRVAQQRRSNARRFAGLDWDLGVNAGASLGNVDISGTLGAGVRAGRGFAGDFGPSRVRPALAGASFYPGATRFGWYVFAELGGRAIGRNIFLDGNTFRDSRSVDKNPFVYDGQAGVGFNVGPARWTFTYVQRSEEFERQIGVTRFGAGSISVRF